jgi:hypothetical protein
VRSWYCAVDGGGSPPSAAGDRALESDEIFVDFITGHHDAFVIEDADHWLTARSNAKVHLHRFLAAAGESKGLRGAARP